MYAAYFGLKQEPFSIAPDPRLLFMSEQHREALAHLLYGVQGGGGFVLLTGEIGTGKTTVCRSFLEQVPPHCNLAYIFNPKLTVLPFLITAMGKALADWPMLNATFDDDVMVLTRHGSMHLGMATQTPGGLMVPVIRDAQGKSVWQLAREIGRLAEAARSGKARRDELSGSTITLSSLGPMGGITSTPVINRPEVAIIAVNKVQELPVIVDGELEARKRMYLSLSCDHRVVDGWDAANFLQAMKAYIENPLRLLS